MIEYTVAHIPLDIARPVITALNAAGIAATITLGEGDVAITIDLEQRDVLDRLLDEQQKASER
jgi:hypothetical protein